MTLLAVSIAAHDTDAALAALYQAAPVADLAELRLDLMHEFDLSRLLHSRPLPVIATCRPLREGGRWQSSERDRLRVLRDAADLGAEYVDLEWDAAGLLASLNRRHSRVILSRHHLANMPAALADQADALWAAGADVVKLVGAANRLAEIIPVLELMQRASRPTIAIAMGACGLATRLLAFRYPAALLSFASLDNTAQQTAPGQISLAAMEALYRVREMTPNTRIIGWLAADANNSPAVVTGNGWLAARRIDARLIPLQHAPGEAAGETLTRLARMLPLAGCLTPAQTGLRCWTAAAQQWSPAAADLERLLDGLLALETEPVHGP